MRNLKIDSQHSSGNCRSVAAIVYVCGVEEGWLMGCLRFAGNY